MKTATPQCRSYPSERDAKVPVHATSPRVSIFLASAGAIGLMREVVFFAYLLEDRHIDASGAIPAAGV